MATKKTSQQAHDPLKIGNYTFHSRLMVGTGKYASLDETITAIKTSGAEVVTVALRKVDLTAKGPNLLEVIDPKQFTILPNTAACFTAEEAVHTARLAREMGLGDLIKLEVIGDRKTLFPDNEGLLEAARTLVKEKFVVLPYFNDDPVMAKKLEDIGCAAVMPLAAPIGSGLGLLNPYNIKIIMESVNLPVIIDAGVGTASDAARAMELGVDGLLMNTGIAAAGDPILMAAAMRQAVDAGRKAYLAKRMPKRLYATASSPLEGLPWGNA